MRQKGLRATLSPRPMQPLTLQKLRFRLTWAALITLVYEVDPLKCPACGGTMKVVALIDHSRQPRRGRDGGVDCETPWSVARAQTAGAPCHAGCPDPDSGTDLRPWVVVTFVPQCVVAGRSVPSRVVVFALSIENAPEARSPHSRLARLPTVAAGEGGSHALNREVVDFRAAISGIQVGQVPLGRSPNSVNCHTKIATRAEGMCGEQSMSRTCGEAIPHQYADAGCPALRHQRAVSVRASLTRKRRALIFPDARSCG
jgi:hypothetical protein